MRQRLGTGQFAELTLPVHQGCRIGSVDLHRLEQTARALLSQPAVDPLGKAAEVLILAISQGEHGVTQVRQMQRLPQ